MLENNVNFEKDQSENIGSTVRPNDINSCSSGVLKVDLAEKLKQLEVIWNKPQKQQFVIKCWVLKQLYECGLSRAAFKWGEVNFQEMPLGCDLPFSLLNHSVALIFTVDCSNLAAALLMWCDFYWHSVTDCDKQFLKQENCQQRLVTSEGVLYSHTLFSQKTTIYLNNFI